MEEQRNRISEKRAVGNEMMREMKELLPTRVREENGTVYFGSWDGYFYAVSPTGDLIWEYEAGEIIFPSPVIGDNGHLYFGAGNELFALDSGGRRRCQPPEVRLRALP